MKALRLQSKKSFFRQILLFCTVAIIPHAASAYEETVAVEKSTAKKIEIPVMKDAQVFAKFNDESPAVINYFTSATEETVLNFYQKNYGEPIKQERKYGHLTLNYSNASQQVRIIISPQKKKLQVDVIVGKSAKEN